VVACAAAAGAVHAPASTYHTHLTPLPRLATTDGYYIESVVPAGDFDADGEPDLGLLVDISRKHQRSHWVLAVVSRRGPTGLAHFDLRDVSTIDLGRWQYSPAPVAAGDVNGDGAGDMLFSHGREAWVVLGAGGTTRAKLLGDGPRAARILGLRTARQDAGTFDIPARGIGDQDGDGLGDIAVGSPGSSPGGRKQAGRVYLINGRSSFGGTLDVRQPGVAAARLDGPAAHARAGAALGLLGDFDGDAHPDLAVGGGTRAWITGAAGPSRRLGTGGDTRLTGVEGGDGTQLASAGDFDGDGLADLGANGARGSSFVAYGARGGGSLDGGSLGSRGIRFEAFGPLTAAGDVSGDGLPDLVIGERVVLGDDRPLPPSLDQKGLDAHGWTTRDSELVPIGDRDGNGHADLATPSSLGVPCWERGGSIAFIDGVAEPPRPPAYGRPTPGPDRLTGTPLGEVIAGHRGNDRLSGRGGEDCISGGPYDSFEADITFRAPRPDKDRLLGGDGDDKLDGGIDADLLAGGRGDDQLLGGGGRDLLRGGPGDDLLFGYDPEEDRPSRDRYDGGPGDDVIESRDFARNRVDCGPGHDRAMVDRGDRVVRCEDVHRARL
jgi:hypothetical protein